MLNRSRSHEKAGYLSTKTGNFQSEAASRSHELQNNLAHGHGCATCTLATSRAQYATLQFALHRRAIYTALLQHHKSDSSLRDPASLQYWSITACEENLPPPVAHSFKEQVRCTSIFREPEENSMSEYNSAVSRPPCVGPPHSHFSPPASSRIFFGDLQQLMEWEAY